MHDLYGELEDLCDTTYIALRQSNERIRNSNGKINSGDVEYLDKLTHMIKSIKTVMAMMEADNGYSSRSQRGGENGSSRNNYRRNYNSYNNRMASELREAMNNSSDERTRQALQRMLDEME